MSRRKSISLRDLSIRQKLQAIIMLTVAAALVTACSAILTFTIRVMREGVRAEAEVLAQMVGDNSTAALTFNDSRVAGELLHGLKVLPGIRGACIYSARGEVFATYQRDRSEPFVPPPPLKNNQSSFHDRELFIFRRIDLDGQPIGAIYLEADLRGLRSRVYRSVVGALAILGLSAVLAYLLGIRLQKLISEPVLQLAQTAKAVSAAKDYTIRAQKSTTDELGQLVEGFNEMLEEIQQRDEELRSHRDRLEEQVYGRMAELEQLNVQLMEAKVRAEAASRAKSDFLAT